MPEHSLVAEVAETLQQRLAESLVVKRGAPLLYQVRVDTNLAVTVDPKKPVRGQSAFETDICVFEKRSADLLIPRVVLEFKTGLSTHDVLTYSAKARRHKGIYPYLRYAIVTARHSTVPGRFFTHNEALDCCLALGALQGAARLDEIAEVVRAEVSSSRQLERIAFERDRAFVYRTELILKPAGPSAE